MHPQARHVQSRVRHRGRNSESVSSRQVADGFTKALSVRKLENFKYHLNLGKL
jgi:hypothetical protein